MALVSAGGQSALANVELATGNAMKTTAILGALALTLLFLSSTMFAQQQVDPALIQQFRADLQQAVADGHITDAQKQQIADDLGKLRQARQDRNRRVARSVFQDLKLHVDKANFKEGDKQKLQADLKQLWAARGK